MGKEREPKEMEVTGDVHRTKANCSVTQRSQRREAKEAEGAAMDRRVGIRGAGGVVGTTPTAKKRFPNEPMSQERWTVRGQQKRRKSTKGSGHSIYSVQPNQ